MEWLNLPLIEGALCIGALVGIIGGFFAGYGVESWTGYNRGFKAGYERAKGDADGTTVRETCTYEIAAFGDGKAWYQCSECGGMASADYDPPKYCPHCGRRVVDE